MTLSKNMIIDYFKLMVFIIISGIMLWISKPTDILIHILSMIILCIGAIYISRFNLIHPYFWYSTIFTIYSISYPILYLRGIIYRHGYTKELMFAQWFALTIFLLIVSPLKNFNLDYSKIFRKNNINKYMIDIILIILVIASIIIKKNGYENKGEIYASNNIFLSIAFILATIVIIIFMYELINNIINKSKINKILILKVGFTLTIMTMFSGERDILFKFIVVTTLILYLFKFINNNHILIMIPIGVFLLPLSHLYKYYFLSGVGGISLKALNVSTIFFEFLNGEFVSASRNLQVILSNSEYTKSILAGKGIINDFIRVFFDTGFSNVSWFNDLFFSYTTTGYGFTLVGEGYINMGYWGIIIIFSIVGFFIRVLYNKAVKNIYYLTIYLYTIPLYMYSIRADLSNIFSQFIKHLLFSMIIIYLLDYIIFKNLLRK